jgi:hypothetical protein
VACPALQAAPASAHGWKTRAARSHSLVLRALRFGRRQMHGALLSRLVGRPGAQLGAQSVWCGPRTAHRQRGADACRRARDTLVHGVFQRKSRLLWT